MTTIWLIVVIARFFINNMGYASNALTTSHIVVAQLNGEIDLLKYFCKFQLSLTKQSSKNSWPYEVYVAFWRSGHQIRCDCALFYK